MARKRYSDEDILKLLREIEIHIHGGKARRPTTGGYGLVGRVC